MAESDVAPKLQAPGAGLPWWELAAARYLIFPSYCRKTTWTAAAQQFQDEGSKVLAVIDALSADQLTRRVLVRRVPGMEDSSRFWSASMTVEHLVMVGSAIRQVIDGLRQGVVPDQMPRIADFKPPGEMPPAEARSQFVRLLADAAADSTRRIPRGQGPRIGHPWFGPLDAHQWMCLLAFHQGIHRKQIEAIRDGLGN